LRVHRLVRILMTLAQNGKVKAHAMAEELEVSLRTIYRDIDVLCEAGYPIVASTGQNGGISFTEGYRLDLDQPETMLKTLITHIYTLPEQERIIHALESGMNLKFKSMNESSEARNQKILIDQKSWWDDSSTEIDIQPVIKALFLQQKLKIQYIQSNGVNSDRVIAPYGLVLKYTTWYLVAYCHSRNEIRTFNCSRIKHINMLKESYSIPDDFDLKSYWTLSIKTFKESKNEAEFYPVEIMAHKSFGAILEKYEIIGVRKAGDSIVVMIDFHRKDTAEHEIRALLCYGQILHPEEMRVKAIEILEKSLQRYNRR